MFNQNQSVSAFGLGASSTAAARSTVKKNLNHSFLKQMEDGISQWLIAMEDGNISSLEISAADNGWSQTVEELKNNGAVEETVYSGAAATLYVSDKVSDAMNMVTFFFNLENKKDDLYKQVSNMMVG
jgi:hypothetical protein